MLRIGIVGTGVGLRTYLPAFRQLSGAEVVGLSGSSAERAALHAKRVGVRMAYSSYRELCQSQDIDLVCVTAPTNSHAIQVECALRSGKHVICEKPATKSLHECLELASVARGSPRQIAIVNYQLRFNPYVQRAAGLLESNELGRPYFIKVHQQSGHRAQANTSKGWSIDPKEGGGMRLAMGSHMVDLLHFLTKSGVVSIAASMDPVFEQQPRVDLQEQVSACIAAHVELANGVTAHLSATNASWGLPEFAFSVFCEQGELHFNLADKLVVARHTKRGALQHVPVKGVVRQELRNESSFFSGTFGYFAKELVQSFLETGRPSVSGAATLDDAVSVHRVLEAMEESANRRATVLVGAQLNRPHVY